MDPFEIDQDDRYEDIYPWKNPKGRKYATRIKRNKIKRAIGRAIGKPKK